MAEAWIKASARIARTEWRRRRREAAAGTQRTRRRVTLVTTVALAVVFGAASRSAGVSFAASGSIPIDLLGIGAGLLFGALALRSSNVTHARFEGLEPGFLLTTVPTRVPALGLLVFVFARIGVFLVGPAVGVAVGTAIGLRSPLVAPTMLVAITGIAALAVGVGVAGRLAAQLVGRRLARGNFYRDLLVVFGWVPVLLAWLVLDSTSVPVASLLERFDSLPMTWIVDLAFLGATGFGADSLRALAAVGTLALTVPLLVGLTTVLVERLWVREASGSTGSHGSHSLVTEGRLEKLLGDYVSRATLTVARERWLTERRSPQGVLYTAYVVFFMGIILMPMFTIVGTPLFLFLVIALGLVTGFAFGSDPIGVKYRVLPMLLTTIGGRQFVGGFLVAALVPGVPIVTAVVVPLGLLSSASFLKTVTLALIGVTLCACTATVSLAVEMGVDRDRFSPVSGFFTNAPVYAEQGSSAFIRMAYSFSIVTMTAVPALLGNSARVYESTIALRTGMPTGAIRLGSLFLTILLAIVVSRIAFQIAVHRYQKYQLR
ncbi:hypothetical protein EL22_05725 [Halostagnicola sp. A56]|uniref:hypothetical protein n=1 Tax=Halostagnicola sp. A56 TaxID=1495067 RepID=UPI0004A18D11|nr:hypothetical protein [Halostagnicola sp. A56]KDE60240.1 hypothetical protein EL22_05725 [Halostagnicola sp. A56]